MGECGFIWEMGLCRCNEAKNFKIKSFWIIWVSPKSDDKCPYERQKNGRHREERVM